MTSARRLPNEGRDGQEGGSESLRGCRVLVVGINYAPEHAGIGPYTTALCRSLAAAGAEVTMVTGVPHYPQWRVEPGYRWGLAWSERDGDIAVKRVRHWVPRNAGLFGRFLMESTFVIGGSLRALRSRSDVVIAVSPSLAAAAVARVARRGRPVGLIVQDLVGNAAQESGSAAGLPARLISSAERRLLVSADLVGTIGESFSELVAADGVARERIRLLPNFTRLAASTLDRAAARERFGWPADRFIVLHTGNMGRKQGLEAVVEAARVSEQRGLDVQFALVGDGNQRAALEREALGVRAVTFTDPVTEDAYSDLLAAADVLLVCERPGVRHMSLPSKVTSYLATGRPILAAVDAAGTTHGYLQERGVAHLVPAGDAEAILRGVEALRNGGVDDQEMAIRRAEVVREELSAEAASLRYQRFAADLWRISRCT